MQHDLKSRLNPSQLQAVTTIDGPVLVIAGAGSGKTRVIEYRVLNLIQNGINPQSILLLTFTRKASHEMISRASKHDPLSKNIQGGTFHSFAYKLLRKYAKAISFSSAFIVLDETDCEEAIHRCATTLGLHERKKRFPKKDTIRSVISMAVNKQTSLEEILKKEYPHFMEYLADIDTLRNTYTLYKIERNYVDYDDLLIYTKLLLEIPEVQDVLSRRYRYIMVDEYQDTNSIQGDIAYLLAHTHHNIMAVGDDAQSIYGFRGASHEHIMRFPDRFPECSIVTLEENYRSVQSILDVANAVLSNMKNKYSKCLVSAKKHAGMKPQLLFFKDVYEEAEWIADLIKKQIDEGIPLAHQCVLFRSMYLSIPVQSELSRRNIPYETYGGLKFYETAHVKDIMAHLKILVNPKDELAWNRLLMLIERIGPKTAGMITDEVMHSSSLLEILDKIFSRYTLQAAFSEGLDKLGTMLKQTVSQTVNPGEKFALILEYYTPLLKDKYDDWHLRLNDLEALRQISMRYNSVEELLEDFAIEPPERGVWGVDPETKEEERPLILSTIHSAKGLEWESVVIMGLVDGVLPISFSLNSEEEIEEEQRLLYVALTRAQTSCFLTLHHEGVRGGITQFNKISRFIDVPNVLSKLDLQDNAPRHRKPVHEKEQPESAPLFDKKTLIQKLMDFHK